MTNSMNFFSGFYQPAGPLIRSASPGGSPSAAQPVPPLGGAVAAAPPTATVQPTVVTSVAASSNNNSRTTSSTSANIRDSGEFSPSQKEQPGTYLLVQ